MHNDIRNATEILKKGGIILFADETSWGIGCDPTSNIAVERALKTMPRENLPEVVLLLENPALIERYITEVPEITWDLVDVSVKPLTIIMPGAKNLAPAIPDEEGNIGIRITRDDFTVRILQRFRRPILFIPVNPHSKATGDMYEDLPPELITAVDYSVAYNQNEIIPAVRPGIIRLWPGGRIDVIRN